MIGLVLSGGGTLGAYQAGVISGLAHRGYEFDWVGGTSIGAINSLVLAQYKPSEFPRGAKALKNFWLKRKGPRDVVRPAISTRGGLLRMDPMERILRKHFDADLWQASPVQWGVAAVELHSGEGHTFTKSTPDPVGAALGSAALPGVFVPQRVKGHKGLFVDGGVRENTPIKSALAAGCSELVVVLCTPQDTKAWGVKNPSMLEILGRSGALFRNEGIREDIRSSRGVPITIIQPKTDLESAFKASPTLIRKRILQGEVDGLRTDAR